MSRLTAALAALLLVFTAGQARANLIVNGTFESAVPVDSSLQMVPTDWTVGNLDPNFSGVLSILQSSDPDGGRFAMSLSNFSNHGLATIQQTVNTVSGTTYDLSYWFRSTGDPRLGSIEFQVLWNGNVIDDMTNPQPSIGFDFTEHKLTVTGTGQDTLEFAGLNNPGFNFLDDVVLDQPSTSVAPEPASITVFGLMATFGLFACARRRQPHAAA